jgi:hypothetical protein
MTRRQIALSILGVVATLSVFGFQNRSNSQWAAPAPFLMATFSNATSSNLFILKSHDGLSWTNPFGGAVYGYGNVRDPSIALINGTYWVTFSGLTRATFKRVMGFAIISSTNLSNFTEVGTVDVSAAVGKDDSTTQVWAPEWFIDSDGSAHIVFCATTTFSSAPAFQIYEVHPTNSNFTAWSDPVQIKGRFPNNMIDPFVTKKGSTYYLWYKNADLKMIEYAEGSSLISGYTVAKGGNWAGWGDGLEGESLVRIDSSTWRIYMDQYEDQGIYYSESKDNWVTWTRRKLVSAPFTPSHPTVLHFQ